MNKSFVMHASAMLISMPIVYVYVATVFCYVEAVLNCEDSWLTVKVALVPTLHVPNFLLSVRLGHCPHSADPTKSYHYGAASSRVTCPNSMT